MNSSRIGPRLALAVVQDALVVPSSPTKAATEAQDTFTALVASPKDAARALRKQVKWFEQIGARPFVASLVRALQKNADDLATWGALELPGGYRDPSTIDDVLEQVAHQAYHSGYDGLVEQRAALDDVLMQAAALYAANKKPKWFAGPVRRQLEGPWNELRAKLEAIPAPSLSSESMYITAFLDDCKKLAAVEKRGHEALISSALLQDHAPIAEERRALEAMLAQGAAFAAEGDVSARRKTMREVGVVSERLEARTQGRQLLQGIATSLDAFDSLVKLSDGVSSIDYERRRLKERVADMRLEIADWQSKLDANPIAITVPVAASRLKDLERTARYASADLRTLHAHGELLGARLVRGGGSVFAIEDLLDPVDAKAWMKRMAQANTRDEITSTYHDLNSEVVAQTTGWKGFKPYRFSDY